MVANCLRQFVWLALLVIAGCASAEGATIVHRMPSPMEPQDAEGPRLLPAVRPATVVDNDPHLISEATPEIQIEYEDFPSASGPVLAEFSGKRAVEPLSALATLEAGCDDALFSNRLVEPLGGTLTYTDLFADQAAGVVTDLQQFYSMESMAYLAGGLAAGAMMANTGFDESLVRDAYLENIVLAPSDEIFESLHQPKFLGDGTYTIPAFAIAALAEPIIDDLQFGSETAQWGQRSLRTVVQFPGNRDRRFDAVVMALPWRQTGINVTPNVGPTFLSVHPRGPLFDGQKCPSYSCIVDVASIIGRTGMSVVRLGGTELRAVKKAVESCRNNKIPPA